MDDVQNQLDDRRVAIDQVGVSDLRYPIVVLDRQFKSSKPSRHSRCRSIFRTTSRART